MNITFLIGNGFDIGMGIKSKFSDYFPIFRKDVENQTPNIKQFCDEIESDYEQWSYFERELGRHANKFSPETKQNFYSQIEAFQKGFIQYLKQQESTLTFENTVAISDMLINALKTFYSQENLPKESSLSITSLYENRAAGKHLYNFVNFNYTSILKKCIATVQDRVVQKRRLANGNELCDSIGTVVHVHGDSDHYPIMGVNDKSQIQNEELIKDKEFLRHLCKPNINAALRMGYDKEARDTILNSSIICVYGMSLGETDRKWWDIILTWLSQNEERHLVIFVFDREYSLSTPFARIEKEDRIIKMLTGYSLHALNAENYRSRIHVAIQRNIFQMDLTRERKESESMMTDEVVAST